MHGLGMWSVAFHNGVEINSEAEFLSIFKTPVFYEKLILGPSINGIVNVEGDEGSKLIKFANG